MTVTALVGLLVLVAVVIVALLNRREPDGLADTTERRQMRIAAERHEQK